MNITDLERFRSGDQIDRMLKQLKKDLSKIETMFDNYKNGESDKKLIIIFRDQEDSGVLNNICIGASIIYEETIGIDELYKAQIKMIKDFIKLLENKFEKI